METWDIASLDVEPQKPEVLRSDPEARVIAINLPASGEPSLYFRSGRRVKVIWSPLALYFQLWASPG